MVTKEIHPLLQRAKDIAWMVPYWDKTDAIVEGHDAIRNAGEEYLPRFPDEPTADYKNRLSITKFTNIYRDTLEGLASKPFEEEITIIGDDADIPTEIKEFAENVDGTGNNLTRFAADVFFNGINSAIDWIFIDYPKVETDRPMSKADVKKAGIKPFWTRVLGRNVLEVRTMVVGSEEKIIYMRILEPSNTDEGEDRVRVFMSDGMTVTWELYEKNSEAKKVEDQMVQIDGGTLSIDVIPFVPFVTGRRDGKTFKIYPTLQDAADLQIVLYQEESGLQFIKTMAGYPMLAANGVRPEKDDAGNPKKIAVGPMKVLYGLPDGNGNHGEWRYIEPNANSMEFLKKSIDSTKQDLRELGRQPLTALSSQLTTVTTSIAAGKARSAVSAWALMLKDALENAYHITQKYMGKLDYKTEINVYNDFDNISDTNADIDNLLTARENGDLSQDTLWFEMKRRKVLSPEFDGEKERQRILNEIPVGDDIEIEDDPEPNNPQPMDV